VHYDIELNSAAHYPVRGIVDLSPAIEQAGFGAFWKGESNSTDPLVLLSAIAARTSKLKLGTAIYHIYGRSAVTLGIQSATIQDPFGAPANISRSSRRPLPASGSNMRVRSTTPANGFSFPGSRRIRAFPSISLVSGRR
jgi:hypothetical protein